MRSRRSGKKKQHNEDIKAIMKVHEIPRVRSIRRKQSQASNAFNSEDYTFRSNEASDRGSRRAGKTATLKEEEQQHPFGNVGFRPSQHNRTHSIGFQCKFQPKPQFIKFARNVQPGYSSIHSSPNREATKNVMALPSLSCSPALVPSQVSSYNQYKFLQQQFQKAYKQDFQKTLKLDHAGSSHSSPVGAKI